MANSVINARSNKYIKNRQHLDGPDNFVIRRLDNKDFTPFSTYLVPQEFELQDLRKGRRKSRVGDTFLFDYEKYRIVEIHPNWILVTSIDLGEEALKKDPIEPKIIDHEILNSDKLTVVVFKNYDEKDMSTHTPIHAVVDCNLICLSAGIKDPSTGLIKGYPFIYGNYEDLCRTYLVLGRLIHDKFLEQQEKKKGIK